MLTSLWFDRLVNWLAGWRNELGMILVQLTMVVAVWLLPPVMTVGALLACGCEWTTAAAWGSVWLVVWAWAIWFAGRQARRAAVGAAIRAQNRAAVLR